MNEIILVSKGIRQKIVWCIWADVINAEISMRS